MSRRGRPSLQDADGRSPITKIRLPASHLQAVQQIAAAHDVSVAAIIRRAVTAYLRARTAASPAAVHPPVSASPATPPARLARSVTRRGSI